MQTRPNIQPMRTVDEEIRTLIDLVNAHRKEVHCPVLVWNRDVARIAQEHSDDMVKRNYFSHDTPDGRTYRKRVDEAKIDWGSIAENIAAGQPTARDVMDSWLKSPGHRANIENCKLQEHGIGLTRGSQSLPYGTVTNAWTHDFVTRR